MKHAILINCIPFFLIEKAPNWPKLLVELVKDTEDMSKLYVVDSQKGTLAEVRLHYPASVKVAASGYTNPIAVAMVHGTVIVAERMGIRLLPRPGFQVVSLVWGNEKAEMEAFVARHEVHVDYEHGQHYSWNPPLLFFYRVTRKVWPAREQRWTWNHAWQHRWQWPAMLMKFFSLLTMGTRN